jgi:hypothetical protein
MTLDSHEIRLGNTYKIEMGDGTYKSDLINLEDLSNLLDDEIDDFYQAMEIDELWLVRLGFIYKGNFHNCINYQLNGIDIWIYADNEIAFGQWKLKYVHQLENLYFALTGKELTYKC